MNKYSITIIESLSKCIIVEAENEEQAYKKAKALYESEQIILYPEECDIDVKYEINLKNIF